MLCVVGMDTYILLFSSQGRVHFGPCCARIVDWVLVQIVVLRVTVLVVRRIRHGSTCLACVMRIVL